MAGQLCHRLGSGLAGLNRLLGKPKQSVEIRDDAPYLSAGDTEDKLLRLLEQPEARRMMREALAETE